MTMQLQFLGLLRMRRSTQPYRFVLGLLVAVTWQTNKLQKSGMLT